MAAFLLATEEELIDQALDMHDKLLHQQSKREEQKREDRLKQSKQVPPNGQLRPLRTKQP